MEIWLSAAARAPAHAQHPDCCLLLAAPLPPVSTCPASEVNVARPKEYWDYESIAVQWGYVCVCVCVCVCVRARVACLLAPAAPLLAQSAVAVPILYSPVCVVAHALDEVCAREFTHGSAQGSRGL
jgi:hypothetical protein